LPTSLLPRPSPAHRSAATSGCGSQGAGFRLVVRLRPNTVYDILVGSQGTVSPQYRVSITAQDGTLVPWPAPAGSFRYPNPIPSLPFTTSAFSVSGVQQRWQWGALCRRLHS